MLEKKDDKKSKEGMNNGEPIERGTDMSTREEEGEYRRNLASLLDKKPMVTLFLQRHEKTFSTTQNYQCCSLK